LVTLHEEAEGDLIALPRPADQLTIRRWIGLPR
jgi:hypothetical protein